MRRVSTRQLVGLAVASVVLATVPAGAQQQGATTASPAVAASAPLFPGVPLRRESSDEGTAMQAIGWLIVALSIAAGAAILFARQRGRLAPPVLGGRLGASGHAQSPLVVGRVALSAHGAVHAIRWGGEELLVASTPTSVSLLARRSATNAPAGEATDAEAKP